MNKTKRDISISMSEAAGKSLLIAVPIAILQIAPFLLIHGFYVTSENTNMLMFGFLLLFGILIHELIHMFAWALFAKKSLKAFKHLTPTAKNRWIFVPIASALSRLGFCSASCRGPSACSQAIFCFSSSAFFTQPPQAQTFSSCGSYAT